MNYSEISTDLKSQIFIRNCLSLEKKEDIIAEIIFGLSTSQKYISSRFFYDNIGSELFEKITDLPEYYPTLTEITILKNIAPKIAKDYKKIDIIELGSGDCSKISILIDSIPKENLGSVRYIPVDVSEAAIIKSAEMLKQKFPELIIQGILADFLKHLENIPHSVNRLFCFFGSTIGNLSQKEAYSFLLELEAHMSIGDQLLLGLDMVKNENVLYDAYNDKQGITAEFNKNVLKAINRITNTNFNPNDFEHLAFYDATKARIEMHLKSLRDVVISGPFMPNSIFIKKGETIHTENSHKFTQNQILDFSTITGLKIEEIYTDNRKWYSLVHFKKQ